jgi:hypothetical protein
VLVIRILPRSGYRLQPRSLSDLRLNPTHTQGFSPGLGNQLARPERGGRGVCSGQLIVQELFRS